MKIAWIGTGVMGSHMIRHLKDGGHEVCIYNRSRSSKLLELESEGFISYDTIAELVTSADVVCTMVGYPKDVEEVYFGTHGILNNVSTGTTIIDFTTSSPKLALSLYKSAKEHGVHVLDAPVSGGDTGARLASLSLMVGGDKEVFEMVKPLLELLGTPHYMGKASLGQHTKACNQIAVAGAVAAMSEAMVYARTVGMDEELMLEAIRGGAAGSWQLNNTANRVLSKDYEPGFYIKHFIKDMRIIQNEMHDRNIELHMLDSVCEMYEDLSKDGLDDKGTQALVKFYDKEKED